MMWELFATVPGSDDEKAMRNRIFEEYRYIDTGGRVRTLDHIVDGWCSYRRTSWTRDERDELRQTVREAVLKAITRHNPARGRMCSLAWATARGTAMEAFLERIYPGLSRQELQEVLQVRRELDHRGQSIRTVDAAALADDMGLPVDRVASALVTIARGPEKLLGEPLSGEDSGDSGFEVEDTYRPRAGMVDASMMRIIDEALTARHPEPENAMFLVRRCLMRGDTVDEAVADLRAETGRDLAVDDAEEVLAEAGAILREVFADRHPGAVDERDGEG